MRIIPATQIIAGTTYISDHHFTNGHTVPVFDVSTHHALNQIIGYMKYINRDYGTVYYRGQCKLHPSLLPSIFHSVNSTAARHNKLRELNKLIALIMNDPDLKKEIGVSNDEQSIVVEGLLQHYGTPTRCIDVVDNHWIALWFGAYQWTLLSKKEEEPYCTYRRRDMSPFDSTKDDGYQYLLLICADSVSNPDKFGIVKGEKTITVDLRSALPSTFVRPHAQHGLILKKVATSGNEDYDLSSQVVGIFRLKTTDVITWIGNGSLLSQQNLFPAPPYDHGYNVLLSRQQDLNTYFQWYVL